MHLTFPLADAMELDGTAFKSGPRGSGSFMSVTLK